MRILKCDLCGAEHKDKSGICAATNDHGYITLKKWARPPGVVDVCASCHKKISREFRRKEKAAERLGRSRFKSFLKTLTGVPQ